MRVLFITRKYPPQKGGMETFSKQLFDHLPPGKSIIYLNKKQTHLLWFIPYALIKALLTFHSYDHIHIGDGALGLLGYILKIITKKPVTITIHGLDITFQNMFYQMAIIPSIAKLSHVIAVSNNTKKVAINHNIPHERISVIPNGFTFSPLSISKEEAKNILSKKYPSIKFNIPILLTAGRLIQRKGQQWFLYSVLPYIKSKTNYIIIGSGPHLKAINKTISDLGINNAHIFSNISNKELQTWYRAADIFIMPNQKSNDSIEGFGIVALEAASEGTPVIASNLEGVTNSVSKETGYLVKPDAKEFITVINDLLEHKERIESFTTSGPQYIQQFFNWNTIIKKYEKVFNALR